MRRVIMSITFDLKFDVSTTPPTVAVHFTDVDETTGEETQGRTFFHDAVASSLLPPKLIDEVKAALVPQAEQLSEPGTVAARVEAAADAQQKARDAQAAHEEAKAAHAATTQAHADKLAQLAAIDAQIAAKKSSLAKLAEEAQQP